MSVHPLNFYCNVREEVKMNVRRVKCSYLFMLEVALLGCDDFFLVINRIGVISGVILLHILCREGRRIICGHLPYKVDVIAITKSHTG